MLHTAFVVCELQDEQDGQCSYSALRLPRLRLTTIAMDTQKKNIISFLISEPSMEILYRCHTVYTYLSIRDVICSILNKSKIFSTDFNENVSFTNFTKISAVRAKIVRTD